MATIRLPLMPNDLASGFRRIEPELPAGYYIHVTSRCPVGHHTARNEAECKLMAVLSAAGRRDGK